MSTLYTNKDIEFYCINSDMYPVLQLDPTDFPPEIWGNIDKMSRPEYMDHYSHGNPYIIVSGEWAEKIYLDLKQRTLT